MKLKPFVFIRALWPLARSITEALNKASDGGKRLTPAERDAILLDFWEAIVDVVDAHVGA